MKTAVSLPDDLFVSADKYAMDNGLTRSALFANALREYLINHRKDNITDRINEVIDQIGQPVDQIVIKHNKQKLRDVEW